MCNATQLELDDVGDELSMVLCKLSFAAQQVIVEIDGFDTDDWSPVYRDLLANLWQAYCRQEDPVMVRLRAAVQRRVIEERGLEE